MAYGQLEALTFLQVERDLSDKNFCASNWAIYQPKAGISV